MSEEFQEKLPAHFWTFWNVSGKFQVILPEELTSWNWHFKNMEGKFLAQWSIRSSPATDIRLSGSDFSARALEIIVNSECLYQPRMQ